MYGKKNDRQADYNQNYNSYYNDIKVIKYTCRLYENKLPA